MKQAESVLVEFDSYSPTMQFKCVVTELRWLISQRDNNSKSVWFKLQIDNIILYAQWLEQ